MIYEKNYQNTADWHSVKFKIKKLTVTYKDFVKNMGKIVENIILFIKVDMTKIIIWHLLII
jgi:hypothetical protein